MIRIPRWIFQATPDRYELREEFREGYSECWEAIDHANKPFRIGEDQVVIFYRAGSREFYGVGRVLSVMSCLFENEKHTQEKGVDVSYDKRFYPPIPAPQKLPKLDWTDGRFPGLLTQGFAGGIFPLHVNDWSNLTEICPRLRTEID